jgi:hypothetical protein
MVTNSFPEYVEDGANKFAESLSLNKFNHFGKTRIMIPWGLEFLLLDQIDSN